MNKSLFIFLVIFIVSVQNISAVYAYGPLDDMALEMRRMRQMQERQMFQQDMQMLMQMQPQQQAPQPQAPRQSDSVTKDIMEMQRSLAAEGYYSGPIDGIWGPRTQAANDAWWRDQWIRDPEGMARKQREFDEQLRQRCGELRQKMEKGDEIAFQLHRKVCLASSNQVPQAPQNATSQGKESSSSVERVSELPQSTGNVLPLPQCVVALSDPAGKRLLKLGMEVEANADISVELQTIGAARIRDVVITLLSGKSLTEVQSSEGKVLLRSEVAARLNQILGVPKIQRVYFTEFTVE